MTITPRRTAFICRVFSSPVSRHRFAAGPRVGASLYEEDGQLVAVHARRQQQRVLILEG